MRTLIVILIGCVLALAFNALFPARRAAGTPWPLAGGMLFIVLWLVATLIDLVVGVQAGHAVGEEAAIHVLVFAVPVALACYLLRRSRAALTT